MRPSRTPERRGRAAFALSGALLLSGACPAMADGPQLSLPAACLPGATCFVQNYADRDPGAGRADYRCGLQTYDGHDGTDFRLVSRRTMREGVAVLAAAPGRVRAMRDGVPDISFRDIGAAAIEGRECGNGVVIDHADGWSTQYCHLARGSVAVRAGDSVAAGDRLGLIGLSGQTEFPHLHFVLRRDGAVVDPFLPDAAARPGGGAACEAGARGPGLWKPEAAPAYEAAALLDLGLADRIVKQAELDAGDPLAPPDGLSPALVVHARLIHIEAGDRHHIVLTDPAGRILLDRTTQAEERPLAVGVTNLGLRRQGSTWPAGTYTIGYELLRGGSVLIRRTVGVDVSGG